MKYHVSFRAALIVAFTCNIVVPSMPQEKSSGAVVFVTDRHASIDDDNREIYSFSMDRKKEERLTNDPAFDGMPDIDPSGRFVVFYSTRDKASEVYFMQRNGEHLVRLTDTPEDKASSQPTWGSSNKIAFSSSREEDFKIYETDISSRLPVKITEEFADAPDLSSDDKLVVFTASEKYQRYSSIYLKDLISGKVKKLVPGANGKFNPSNTEIVFDRAGAIYTISLANGFVKRLSPAGAFDSEPCYSPDGKDIVFSSYSSLRSARGIALVGRKKDIYRMKADGTEVVRLTFSAGNNFDPSWGLTPGVPYAPPPAPLPAPDPQIQPLSRFPESISSSQK